MPTRKKHIFRGFDVQLLKWFKMASWGSPGADNSCCLQDLFPEDFFSPTQLSRVCPSPRVVTEIKAMVWAEDAAQR